MSDYTLERISAELDAIFGRDHPLPSHSEPEIAVPAAAAKPTLVPAFALGPSPVHAMLPLFVDAPRTPHEAVSLHARIFAYVQDDDDFLEGMIRYQQRKERDAAKAKKKHR